tara:strand:- start:1202 stop:2944 length:1743 start_codon:yes stop_codon:yes gene_type:complete
MADLLQHRGPDCTDFHIDSNNQFAFANTRLAISDPDSQITQPWTSPDRKFVLTFNGEIYNDLHLRNDLISKGSTFHSNQDTEVLFNGLVRKGPDFLNDIDGMWAFAFYNANDDSLILSRDVLGERQLFYYINGNEIIFASEIPPLLHSIQKIMSLDTDQIMHSLRFGAPQPGETLISGIKKLNPGHILKVKNGEINTYRFTKLRPEVWFDFFESNPDQISVENKFSELFSEVCLRRVPRDIPYISTLSAGIDSTLVSLYSSNFGNTHIDTLFASSHEDDLKSVEYASLNDKDASLKIASQINSNHHIVNLDTIDSVEVLRNVASNSFDGMLEEGTAAFQMLGIRGRELGVKVMLISDGPDEFLAGYNHDANLIRENYKGDKLAFDFPTNHETNNNEIMSFMFPEYDSNRLTSYFGKIDKCYESILGFLDTSQLIALSYASYSIPDYNNLRSDRGFMAASIESRSPFLAPQMVEFLIALPHRFRIDQKYSSKAILRNIVDKKLGSYVSNRPKKGFSEPLWYNSDLKDALKFDEVISDPQTLQILPFSKSFKEKPYSKPFHKIRWSMYALAKMHDNLKSKRY